MEDFKDDFYIYGTDLYGTIIGEPIGSITISSSGDVSRDCTNAVTCYGRKNYISDIHHLSSLVAIKIV